LLVFSNQALSQEKIVTIGTGAVTGVYYPVGGAICRLLNLNSSKSGYNCVVKPTGGSIDNISSLQEGDLEFALVQSDWQSHAYNGSLIFEATGKFDDLRAVFSLYSEVFTLVVRADSNINSFQELQGKRVNIGNSGSGQRGTMERAMDAFGMSRRDFSLVTELPARELANAICNDKIDAFVYTVGHPATAITEATNTCDVKIIELKGEQIDHLLNEFPFYRLEKISGGLYRGNDDDLAAFGMAATLVTSTASSEEDVYTLIKTVFENFSDFKRMHPALTNLKELIMISDSLTAPLHDGAIKYYKERGWME